MELSPDDLREIYEALIKPSGHPDPMGFMARIILTSGGDPDYVHVDGKMGLMPVTPDYAFNITGSKDVQSLQGNIMTTLAMDTMLFQNLKSLKMAIIKFHDGFDAESPSPETAEILEELPDARIEIRDAMYPPLATVADVIRLITPDDKTNISNERLDFFKFLSR